MRLACVATVVLAAVAPAGGAGVAWAEPVPPRPQDVPVVATPDDPDLARDLDAVVAISPEDTCLSVEIDGVAVYGHRGGDPQAPASTQKLLTAGAALDRLGPQARLTTRVLGRPPSGGVVEGDVVLVGGGDPTLTTSIYRIVRQIPTDRPVTLIDELADQLQAAGVARILGRIVADGTRHDDLAVVPTWPDRFVGQDVVGPLGALAVDGGHLLVPAEGGGTRRVRSQEPAVDAARALTAILRSRGIEVGADPVAGTAPADAGELAAVDSPPVGDIVTDLLLRSDNREAEVLTKELGVAAGTGGTTAAGTAAIGEWLDGVGAAAEGTRVVDGSGLDPTNLVTCDQLLAVLEATGGRAGPVAAGLPIAGESGTLAARFRGSSAAGRLRAKTGSLNGVTSLAGFVDLPAGGVASFAYIANASAVDADVRRAQDVLGAVLATYVPPCPTTPAPGPIAAPGASGALASVGAAIGGPGAVGAAQAGAATALAAQRRASSLVDRCSAEAGVQVVLVP